jgi:hypothetical protein
MEKELLSALGRCGNLTVEEAERMLQELAAKGTWRSVSSTAGCTTLCGIAKLPYEGVCRSCVGES